MHVNRLLIAFLGTFFLVTSVGTTAYAETLEEPHGSDETGAQADTERQPNADSKKPAREDHFRIGVLGGVGFPRPLAIEGMFKIEKMIGLGIEYSVLPTFTAYGVETTFHALAADASFFPLRGPFFLGVRVGRQHIGGVGTVVVNGLGASGSMTVDTTFVNPRIGFLWTLGPGLTIGMDAGVQIPVSSTVTNSIPVETTASRQATRIADTFGNSVIPTIDVLRLGILL